MLGIVDIHHICPACRAYRSNAQDIYTLRVGHIDPTTRIYMRCKRHNYDKKINNNTIINNVYEVYNEKR